MPTRSDPSLIPATRTAQANLTRLGLLMFVILLAGCAEIRLFTYPSHFVWLDESDVQGVMYDMATHLGKIDEWIDPENDDQSHNGSSNTAQIPRDEIIAALLDIEVLAMSLKSSGSGQLPGEEERIRTNHLLLDDNIDEFIAGVNRARWQVEADPPSYYAVGQLAGNCTACHRRR